MSKEYTQTAEQALQGFLLDIDCLNELLPWTGRFNLFDVLKISRTEIRHSNMLAWLLNPNENHGMGDACLKEMLQRVVENNCNGKYDVFKLLLLDLYSFTVLREWKNIDLLLISEKEKLLIAIENKVGSHEHDNQLDRYRGILQEAYPKWQQIYLYLTPDGEPPSDGENWSVLTYNDIVAAIDAARQYVDFAPDVDLMIRNYIDVIRRDIVDDQQLIDICNKIYRKHSKALDLIYEHCTTSKNQVSAVVRATLQELSDAGIIIFEDSGKDMSFSFRTKEMDQLLPLLDDNSGAWGTENIYSFWLGREATGFTAIFELGGMNVPVEQRKIMNKLIDVVKPNDKRRDNFRYKRLYSQRYLFKESDNVAEVVHDVVVKAVEDMLAWEKKVLAQIS